MPTHRRGDERAGASTHAGLWPPATGRAAPKKARHASARDSARVPHARAAYRALLIPRAREHLTFRDEAGVNVAMTRRDGRAPRGERGLGAVPQHSGATGPRLAALAGRGGAAVMTRAGATDAEGVRASVEDVLGPPVVPGAIVVMDHLRAHQGAGIRERSEACRAPLLYWPPYAPDLSPLEPCWSTRKTFVRAAQARPREALDAAIEHVLAAVTPSDARGWFPHGGST